METIRSIFILVALGMVISCGGGDETSEMVSSPTVTTLIFPQDNTECNEGTIVSDFESEVIFMWEDSPNNDSYTLKLTNLNSGVSKVLETNLNEFPVIILRGVPYSWSVISEVENNPETVESETWKFYNAGLSSENHPPFPAEVISPVMGSSIDSGSIVLRWQSSDVDNDIASHNILIDTVNPPISEISGSSDNFINVDVAEGQIYYWRVITIDVEGNTSNSEVFQFKVN